MATQGMQKTKQEEQTPPRSRALSLFGEFPFFLSRMRDEFDRMFERFSLQSPGFTGGNGWRWGVDVEDKDDMIEIRAEAPGFEAGDFDVQIAEGQMVLKATKKTETKDKEGKRQESREQEYYESVRIPAGIDKDKVEAKYRNGVLTITMPKTPEGKAKRVAVKNA